MGMYGTMHFGSWIIQFCILWAIFYLLFLILPPIITIIGTTRQFISIAYKTGQNQGKQCSDSSLAP